MFGRAKISKLAYTIVMYIVQVIPIAKGMGKETLSYFSTKEVVPGSLVSVPVRSKIIPAIVVESQKASELKSELKRSDFAVKKVDSLKAKQFLRSEYVQSALHLADHCASTAGATFYTLLPKIVLENITSLKTKIIPPTIQQKPREKCILQGDDADRFANYRSLIREQFAKKSSVFFCVPTVEDAKISAKALEKGIEKYTIILHSSMGKKAFVDAWNQLQDMSHPILIVATGPFLSIPRTDISTIILEKENSRSYKSQIRPFLDIRTFTEYFAEKIHARLVLGDIALRIETIWRHKNGEFVELSPLTLRSLSTAKQELIDMRKHKKPDGTQGSFKILSPEVERLIEQTRENSEHLFILSTRRGLAPSTVCGDCQNIVTCTKCSAPITLHKGKDETQNFFLCHRCGERRSALETCKICGSWKLGTVGIGIDLVDQKIRDRFPETKVFRIDADTTKTEKSVIDTVAKFYASPGSTLIGTEMALSYLHEKIENSAIISIDSLFSIPDFRISEKIFYLLLKMRYIARNTFLVQTRNAEEKVLEYAMRGNIIDFYRTEIESRKQFDYPPFSTLIKLTLEGKRDAIVTQMDSIQNTLVPHVADIFPAFTHTVKGNYVLHGLIKLPRGKWIDPDLLAKLKSLPPSVGIKVDPDSLL